MLHIILQISEHHPGGTKLGRLSVPRGHEHLALPLLRHIVPANVSHTALPIRPNRHPTTWDGPPPCLYGLANVLPGKRPLAHDPNTNAYSMTCPQYPNGYRIGNLLPSNPPSRHLTTLGSHPSFIPSTQNTWLITLRLSAIPGITSILTC